MSTWPIDLPKTALEPAVRIAKVAIESWSRSAVAKATHEHVKVFVTVNRQPGVGAVSFSHKLAQRLKHDGQGDWSPWNRELAEKVSAEHGIAKSIIEMIETRRDNWVEDLMQTISTSHVPSNFDEVHAYKLVVITIRALAIAGHAIIVGRGSLFVTEGMAGAIHLRLIAPLDHRINCVAEREKISLHEAAAKIVELDQLRAEFYRRYWPGKEIEPETFDMTLNTSKLSEDELVECVLPAIRGRQKQLRSGGTKGLAK